MNLEKQILTLWENGNSIQEIALELNIHEAEVKAAFDEKDNDKQKSSAYSVVQLFETNKDLSAKDLAAQLGISYQYVARCLKEAGHDIKARSEEIRAAKDAYYKAEIRRLYDESATTAQISKHLGLSTTTVRTLADEMGLQLKGLRANRRKQRMEYLVKRRLEGADFQTIADELGVSYNYALNIATYARSKGIELPNLRDKDESGVEYLVQEFEANKDLTVQELAKKLDFSYQYVARCLKSAGCDVAERNRTIKEAKDAPIKAEIQRMHEESIPLSEVCKHLGISRTKVCALAEEMGLELQVNTRRKHDHDQDLNHIIELRKEGYSYEKIADELDVSLSYVSRLVKKARSEGVDVPQKSRDAVEDTNRIIELRKDGYTYDRIAKELNVSSSYISRLVKKARNEGIHIPDGAKKKQ